MMAIGVHAGKAPAVAMILRRKEKSPRRETRANPPKEEVEETRRKIAQVLLRCNILISVV